MQCNVEFVYQLSICSKDRGKPRKTLIELALKPKTERKSIFMLEGSQDTPARPSGRDNVKVKTLW
jgi:hypothetical protein